MMVMPSNHSGALVHYWAGRFPGRVGWLVGPSGMDKTKLRQWMPYACDNDAFAAWVGKTEWSESAWVEMLDSMQRQAHKPLWILVPDVVTDREATIAKWDRYHQRAAKVGSPLAFAVQDGMMPEDVPTGADVVFVGGTTDATGRGGWKWQSLPMWVNSFPRVHVGRVNTLEKLMVCERLGVESVDGTGWFRGSEHSQQTQDLRGWLEGRHTHHPELNLI